jgi:carbon monoxide dehydrogenase subunit G
MYLNSKKKLIIMKTTIEKKVFINQTIEKTWELLSDPPKIVSCVPGAQLTETIDQDNYKGIVSMKFGPVAVKYNGQVKFEKRDNVNHEMILNGKGLDDKGKGSADMILNAKLFPKDGQTEVQYSMEVNISGMLAQFGSRLITDVSNQVADQFSNNFKKKAEGEESAAGEEDGNSLNALSMAGSILKSKIGGLFGGGKKEGEGE